LYLGAGAFRKRPFFLRGGDFFLAGFFLAVAFALRGAAPLKMLSQPVEYLTFEPV
jgi:hypothetical protein